MTTFSNAVPVVPATVHEPTVTGIPPVRPYLRELRTRGPLIWHMARSQLKSEHYDTVFGQVWIVLNPLLLAAVYYLLRSVIRPMGDASQRALLVSHLIWALFFFYFVQRSVQAGARCILANRQMIMNTSFPRAIFPIAAVIKGFLDFVPTIVVYFGMHALLGQPFGLGLVCIPLIVGMLAVFTLGCALILAPLTVFFRDMTSFIPYLIKVWLYMSPILYRVAEIPENLSFWLRLNPLYPMFAALEQIFTGGWPSPVYLVVFAAVSVAFFLVGAAVFMVRERDFATRF